MTRALILGLPGQDGSYLAEFLLARGLEVHGTCRPGEEADPARLWRLAPFRGRLTLHPLDLADGPALERLVRALQPGPTFHLAGTRKAVQSPGDAAAFLEGALGTTHALLRALCHCPDASLVFAASSEMYGPGAPAPQDESTPFDPRDLYGIAKAAGVQLVRHYREHQGLRACSAILFNHESPRRGPEFVTRRITQAAARIHLGLQDRLVLGDLEARRDWGHARSFARGLALMADQREPEDLVLATGRTRSVRDFLDLAFRRLDLDPARHVQVDPALLRPPRGRLVGQPARALKVLGWQDDVPFEALVAEMVDADLAREAALSTRP